jgi:hypothetical protein
MTGSGKLRLQLTRCLVSDGSVTPAGPSLEAMINPASIQRSHSISYSGTSRNDAPFGRTSVESKFDGINAEHLMFELIFDGTGVVPGPVVSVMKKVQQLKTLIYDYDGNTHEPNVVRVTWGKLESFEGRMESMDIDYTVFKPSGDPLRAKIKINMVSFLTHLESSLRAKRSSPDMTHEVLVRDGDTLPLLCHRIYGDSQHYQTVARANGLNSFRRLTPGSVLRFAPLE